MALEDADPLARTLWARDRWVRLRNRLRIAFVLGPIFVLAKFVAQDGTREMAGRIGVLVLLTAGIAAWFMAVVLGTFWPPRARGVVRGGTLTLRYSRGYRFVLPAALASPGLLIGMEALHRETPDHGLAAFALGVMVPPAVLLAIAFRASVEVTEAGIAHRSPWSRMLKAIAWCDVTALETDRFRALVIRGPGKRTIRAHLALDGLPELAAIVRAHVVRNGVTAWPAALEIQEALVDHPVLQDQISSAPGGRVQAWLATPALTLPVSLLLGGLAAYSLRLANTPPPEPAFTLPAGWVAGVPAQLAGTPLGGSEFLSVAHEPGTRPIPSAQLFWAELAYGELDAPRAARNIGELYLGRLKRSTATGAPEARLREQVVTTVSGVEAARVEIDIPSEEIRLIVYAVPLGGRIGLLNYSCAESECDRLRFAFERAAGATQGLAPPTYRNSPRSRRDLAGAGVLALFASVLLGGEALVALARMSSARVRPERR